MSMLPKYPETQPGKASTESCAICHEALLIPSSEDEGPSWIIDDVELSCGHHFHWSCIMEYAQASPRARENCSLCRAKVVDNMGRFIVSIKNEGGFTGGFDLGEEIDREAFLEANPEIRRKELFLSLMSQGDFEEAEQLLQGTEPGSDGTKMNPNVVYDGGEMTAMHMAALNDDVEGIELLLKYGADKNKRTESGQTALELAKEVGAQNVVALLSR